MYLYQDDFLIPGMRPSLASSLKQMRQTPKSLMKPFFLPQRKQRRTILEENFGFLFARATTEVFAIWLEEAEIGPGKIKSPEKALWGHTSKRYPACQIELFGYKKAS